MSDDEIDSFYEQEAVETLAGANNAPSKKAVTLGVTLVDDYEPLAQNKNVEFVPAYQIDAPGGLLGARAFLACSVLCSSNDLVETLMFLNAGDEIVVAQPASRATVVFGAVLVRADGQISLLVYRRHDEGVFEVLAEEVELVHKSEHSPDRNWRRYTKEYCQTLHEPHERNGSDVESEAPLPQVTKKAVLKEKKMRRSQGGLDTEDPVVEKYWKPHGEKRERRAPNTGTQDKVSKKPQKRRKKRPNRQQNTKRTSPEVINTPQISPATPTTSYSGVASLNSNGVAQTPPITPMFAAIPSLQYATPFQGTPIILNFNIYNVPAGQQLVPK